MAEIYVASSQSIQDVINELQRLNGEFTTKASDIDREHTSLTQKWEGDASTAFEEHYQNERQNFDVFSMAIDEYIQGLTNILENYNTAEDKNKTIASD